jgi:hypothetical protein
VIWVLGVGSGVNDTNVAATLLRHGNFDYVTNSVMWDPAIPNHDLPDSLYLSGKPAWWCQETPWPPIGPDVPGYSNPIPAQRGFEGLPCSQSIELTLSGIPGDQTISLAWQVNASLPVTATWRIIYDGPPGDKASPIIGLAEPTRAYTLTGMTNYASYAVTLNAMLDSSPVLTATLTAMPTDMSMYLPVIFR